MVKIIKSMLNKISKVIFVETKKTEEVNVTKEMNKAVNNNFYKTFNGLI